jgi:transcriptional regulator with XRE-family HTH domain
VDTVRQPISASLLTRPLLTSDDPAVTSEETVGQRIRRLRLSRGLSQRELAGPGVSYTYISRIEGGQRQPTVPVLRYLAGRLGVGADYLEDGRAIAAAKERELRLADAELELRLGNDLRRAGEILHALLAEAVPDGLEVRIRAALGTLLAREGDNEEAARQLERVVASGGVRPETRPDVYETLSRVYLASNAAHMATRLLEECIAEVDRDRRHATAQIRYRSFLANALASTGALKRAAAALEQATELAERSGGLGDQVALHWERARLFWMLGDGDASLSAFGYARALAQIADDTLQVARAHLASAQILNLEGRFEEAGPHLERAERLLEFGEDTADRGVLLAEQAKREAKLGDGARALALAQQAAGLLAEHSLHAPNADHALGAAHVATGNVDAAEVAYDRAVSALTERGQWREAIRVARDWADALRAAGRDTRAYTVLEQATEFGQRIAATHVVIGRAPVLAETQDA